MAIDYARAMAASKAGAEGGHAGCQWQVGTMNFRGFGVDVNYEEAWAWFEKAAAQDYPMAVGQLAVMYYEGVCVTPSYRRARELWQRAIELGDQQAAENMQNLIRNIAGVT